MLIQFIEMTEIFHRFLANKIMQKCYCHDTLVVGDILLSAEESHHLLHVVRVRNNEKIIVLNGRGQVGYGCFVRCYDKIATVHIDMIKTARRPSVEIVLLQSALVNNCNDHIVREATAIGVNKIVFCETQYSECKLAKKIDAKLSRWNTIAIESCKQSGNPFLPEISYEQSLENVVVPDGAIKLFGGLSEHAVPMLRYLDGITSDCKIIFAVGPEGDFSSAEYSSLRDKGFNECCLARSVLRAETAAIYAMSVLNNWRFDRDVLSNA